MAKTVFRSTAAVLGALAYVASATGTYRTLFASYLIVRAHRVLASACWTH